MKPPIVSSICFDKFWGVQKERSARARILSAAREPTYVINSFWIDFSKAEVNRVSGLGRIGTGASAIRLSKHCSSLDKPSSIAAEVSTTAISRLKYKRSSSIARASFSQHLQC